MATRWATFDCYGTLIDWNRGIREALARLWPEADSKRLLERYHEIEPEVERELPTLPYRDMLAECLRRLADDEERELAGKDEGILGNALPSWPLFPEVPAALGALRACGWRLAVLSNTDPDLLAASLQQIGVSVDETVTAREAGSYKPAHGHWRRFIEKVGGQPAQHVHVAASLFHDVAPAAELRLPCVWINRLDESSDLPRAAELPDLAELPRVLEELSRASRPRALDG